MKTGLEKQFCIRLYQDKWKNMNMNGTLNNSTLTILNFTVLIFRDIHTEIFRDKHS